MATDLGAEFHARCQQLVEDIERVLRFRRRRSTMEIPSRRRRGLFLGGRPASSYG